MTRKTTKADTKQNWLRHGGNRMTPFIMFPKDGVQALALYKSAFGKDYEEVSVASDGKQLHQAHFRVKGQDILAMDGGPTFGFAEGLSFFVECADQKEVDHLWKALTAKGGKPGRCGWLLDAWGISWQIIPRAFIDMAAGPPAKAQAMFQAMLKMDKMIVKDLQKAYDAA